MLWLEYYVFLEYYALLNICILWGGILARSLQNQLFLVGGLGARRSSNAQ